MTMTYQQAKIARTVCEASVRECKIHINSIPGVGTGAMGLTPDAVKAMPEYRSAKAALSHAMVNLQGINAMIVKMFKRELAEERKAKRAA